MDNLKPSYYFNLSNYAHQAIFQGCEYVWEVLPKIEKYLKAFSHKKLSEPSPQAYIENSELVSIGKNTTIEPGAYIKGPCIIGDNCTIRHGAYIRGNLITGNHCVIGHDTEIKNVIFLDHANAAHFAYLGDSIIGNYANLGAGTKCANLRLDHAEIYIQTLQGRIATGLKKFGAIIGDHTQTGCNSVTNPGTLCGKEVYSYPCLNFGGIIASGEILMSSSGIIRKMKQKRDAIC